MMKPKKPEKGSPGLLRQQASRPSTKRVLVKYEVVSMSQDHVSPYPGNTVLQRAILRQQSRVGYVENCGALFMPLSRGDTAKRRIARPVSGPCGVSMRPSPMNALTEVAATKPNLPENNWPMSWNR